MNVPSPLFISSGERQVDVRVAHARRQEDVLEAVAVEVARRDAPRPERLDAGLVGRPPRTAAAEVVEERVAEDDVVAVATSSAASTPRPRRLASRPLDERAVSGPRTSCAAGSAASVDRGRHPHVGVHVDEEEVEAPVAVVVEHLRAHGAPRASSRATSRVTSWKRPLPSFA